MTSKYWTTSHKSSVLKSSLSNALDKNDARETLIEAESTSCGDSIEEDVVTIKASVMDKANNDANAQSEPSKTFSTNSTSIKRRPDSLKLSFDYGSNDLTKSATSTVDVNQNKSPSVAGNKSNHDGKKSTSYDLWVNENVGMKDRNGVGENKKLDLPGRVSFRYVECGEVLEGKVF
jgi:hypothetical protein